MRANRRVWAAMTAFVLAVWLVGTWVTKYSLEEMALYAPIAVLVLGATAGLVMLWVKVIMDSRGRRRSGEH